MPKYIKWRKKTLTDKSLFVRFSVSPQFYCSFFRYFLFNFILLHLQLNLSKQDNN
ncbi:hypothetical protein PIN17_0259 [Prevotella intermedia 17]|nr:hypothetical protein PIN17_0259 [Prevotella intermedia 17]